MLPIERAVRFMQLPGRDAQSLVHRTMLLPRPGPAGRPIERYRQYMGRCGMNLQRAIPALFVATALCCAPGAGRGPALVLRGARRARGMGRARSGVRHLQARQAPVADRHPRRQGGGPARDQVRLQALAAQGDRQRPHDPGELRAGQLDRRRRRRATSCVQFHFHKPSEEKIDGKAHAMVAHLVHKSADGKLAVVAVLLDKGGANPTDRHDLEEPAAGKGEGRPPSTPPSMPRRCCPPTRATTRSRARSPRRRAARTCAGSC